VDRNIFGVLARCELEVRRREGLGEKERKEREERGLTFNESLAS
jgi:hypothetical protein